MPDEFMKFVKKAMSAFSAKEEHGMQGKTDIQGIDYFEVMNISNLTGQSQGAGDNMSEKKKSIKDEVSTFFTETSFTALTQIYKANSLWKRLLWSALVLAMIVYMGIQCYWLLDKYYSYPLEVKLDFKASRVLDFPSVTICNLNPITLDNVRQDQYRLLEKYANPNMHDMLFQATLDNFKNEGRCDDQQFPCKNGQCLHESVRCNGNRECRDGDDESHCEDYACKIYQWKCASLPKCIFRDKRCDGIKGDCAADSDEDEADCQNNTCPDGFFRCSTGRCIPFVNVCDGNFHCGDDEVNCSAHTPGDLRSNDVSSNSPPATSSQTSSTAAPVSEAQTLISSSTAATTNSRRKRAALFHLLTEKLDSEIAYSKDEQDLYDEMVNYLVKSKNSNRTVVVKYLRAIWQVVRDHLKTEFLDYLTSKEKDTLRWKQVKDGGNIDAKAVLHRLKRQGRAPMDFPTSKTNLEVNIEAMVRNSTFNKWESLPKLPVQSSFYEERDDEYNAAMTYAYITSKLKKSVVEKSGHQKQNFIASCDFAGYQCSPDNFTYFHNSKYGNCYIFNWLSPNTTKLETRFAGPEQGLRLELFLDQKNYVANLATEAGVRVVIHKKGSMPFPENEGVSVMPGRSTTIGIKQVSYKRLPPPHGVCGDKGQTTDYYSINYGTNYSKLSCLKSCYQDISIKVCNCAVPFYYVSDDMDVCNMTDKDIERCVTGLANNHSTSFDACDKLCPLPCQETKYDLSVSMAQWPSNNYQPFLTSRLGQTNSLYCRVQDSEREFTKLQIYFQDLIYQVVEQEKAYEISVDGHGSPSNTINGVMDQMCVPVLFMPCRHAIQSMNLISDLGGQLGLWLGLSAITLGELCSFLFGVGRSMPMKCWRKKTAPGYNNDVTPVRPFTPATLQAMIDDMCPRAAKYAPPDNTTDQTSNSTSKM